MKRDVVRIFVSMLLILILASGCSKKTSDGDALETDISSEKKVEYTDFQWPKSEIAKLLPVPKSNIGRIEWEASYGFVIYVAETSKEDYGEYVDKCWENGFTIDCEKGDDYFWADNENGYKVSVRYKGDDVMFVRLDEPDETSIDTTVAPVDENPEESTEKIEEKNDISEESVIEETFVEESTEKIEETLTVENCEDLNTVLLTDAEIDDSYLVFAETYAGSTISFDACITYITNHEDYNTRYDILLSGGDYVDDNTSNPGPTFKFENVNILNLGIEDLYLPDFVSVGSNVRITAKILSFNKDTGLFFLDPILIEER